MINSTRSKAVIDYGEYANNSDLISHGYKDGKISEEEISKRVEVVMNLESMTRPEEERRTMSEVTKMITTNLETIIDVILTTIDNQKRKFKENGLEKFWTGEVIQVTQDEIIQSNLIYDIDSVGLRYHKSNIMKLAHLFRRREGLSLKVSTAHAWFWARRFKFDEAKHIANPIQWMNKKSVYEAEAIKNRRLHKMPMHKEWHTYNELFKSDMKLWESLKSDCKLSAPKKFIPHWNVNVGNTFMHTKYGECRILRHLKPKGKGWSAEYQPLHGDKSDVKFKKELDLLYLEIFTNWEVKQVANEDMKKMATKPCYFPPMWS